MAGIDVVDLPDREAVEHFRAKRNRQDWNWSFDWRDVSAEEHLVQFTFAKAARLDLVEAVRAEVDRAVADGTTLRQFVDTLKPRLQKLGWWGEQEMVDPRTGETRLVDVGPRRLRTIFDTNLRMAHARGRWERVEALKEDMPYLRYVATLDARTRPDHRRWHGTVLPVDDPWWRSHYPPNGWRCRCQVVQLSEDDMRRRGWRETPRPKSTTRKWTNKRTGEVVDVPEGIDPGFERNVGLIDRAAAAQRFLAGKVAAAKTAGAGMLLQDAASFAIAGRTARRSIEAAAGKASEQPAAFRAELSRRLRATRGAGTETANVAAAAGAAKLARMVRDASRLLPAPWVRAGNAHGALEVSSLGKGKGGSYSHASKRISLHADSAIDAAVHEYVHHLQGAMPGFQRLFREEHLRRTTTNGKRDPLTAAPTPWWKPPKARAKKEYRKDGYIDHYMGMDYGKKMDVAPGMDMPDGDALEVATTAYQIVLHSRYGDELLHKMAQRDPLTLDLALGLLFRFDP